MSQTRAQRWKTILQIAWPLIIANSFWNLQITIDRIYLGRFSTEALGAAIAVMGVFWTPMALLQQTAAYSTTFVAQYFGARRFEMIGSSVWQSLYLSVIGGLLFLVLIPLSPWVFELIGHSEVIRPMEVDYFTALSYSALPTALVASASAFFTGLGRTKTIMAINFVGLVANVILDYIMIFGKFGFPAMGIKGAGLATAIASMIGAIFGLYLVFTSKHEHDYRLKDSWKFQWDLMKRFLKYGLPSGMQWALEGLAFTIFLIIVGRMKDGDAGLASSSIVVTVMMLAILPAMGVAQAVSVLLGQHLGEKNPERAEADVWSGFQVCFIYIALMSVTFALFPNFYLSWFMNEENAQIWHKVQIMVPHLLLFVAFFILFDSMNLVFSFSLKGAGDTRFVSIVALIIPWPLMVLPTWLMKDWENAIYWGWGAASVFGVTQAMIFLARFKRAKWKSMSVINETA